MKKLAIGSIIFMGLIILIIFLSPPPGWKANLVNPISRVRGVTSTNPSATPTSPNAPKTYKFDSTTDLKKELDSINPQVLDSNFAE